MEMVTFKCTIISVLPYWGNWLLGVRGREATGGLHCGRVDAGLGRKIRRLRYIGIVDDERRIEAVQVHPVMQAPD